MSLTLAPEQRRGYTIPIVLAILAPLLAIGIVLSRKPHHPSKLDVTHTVIFAPRTTFKASTGGAGGVHIIGQQPQTEQNLYAVVTIHVHDGLRAPLYIAEVDGSYTGAAGDAQDAVAPSRADLVRMQEIFPELKPLMPHPLVMGDSIPAQGEAEGQVLLHYNALTEQDWAKRKPSTITMHFEHQDPLTATIP